MILYGPVQPIKIRIQIQNINWYYTKEVEIAISVMKTGTHSVDEVPCVKHVS